MRSRASIQSHPIHPMLVGFPIALWVAGLIFDLIGTRGSNAGLWAAGFYSVIGGCVGAVLAAAAGVIDWLYHRSARIQRQKPWTAAWRLE